MVGRRERPLSIVRMVSITTKKSRLKFQMSKSASSRTYFRYQCVIFWKTREQFGPLSNMAGGFPIRVNQLLVPSVEALYQACRYPHLPEVQKLIVGQRSPMTAKMVGKPYREDTRPDWEDVKVDIMRWCLRVKYVQHGRFADALHSTGLLPIVEKSRKDTFWGAKEIEPDRFEGCNVLGRLLMQLRAEATHVTKRELFIKPPEIPCFTLLSEAITIDSVLGRQEFWEMQSFPLFASNDSRKIKGR